jgi:hypothetical protein
MPNGAYIVFFLQLWLNKIVQFECRLIRHDGTTGSIHTSDFREVYE